MHLMLAVTKQNLYAHDTARIKQYVGDPVADPAKKEAWKELQRLANVKFQNLRVNNTLTSEFLAKVVPIARKRGLFVIAYSGAKIYVATGPKAFRQNEFGAGIFDHCRRMSITRPKEGVNSPAAQYDLWVLDSGYTKFAYHNRLNTRTRELTGAYADYVGPQDSTVGNLFSDWWPVPDPGNTFTVYGARDYAQGGAVEAHTWNKDAKTFERINWRAVTGPKVVQVRVAKPLATLPDDPDKDEMPAWLLKDGHILYGTLEGSTDILVWHSVANTQAAVRIPMSVYRGVAVDPYFLWMYGDHGFACATHASVMSCVNKKRSMPLWLGPPVGNLAPVLDLSSCEDGTLLVCTPNRLSNAVYHVDFKTPSLGEGQRLTVEKWEDLAAGWGAAQVQKLPIFGWPLIERSVAAVTQTAAAAQ
jgi:hypothetical protein